MSKIWRFLAYTLFVVVGVFGAYATLNVQFKFNFEDYFPQNDPDLDFFVDFVKDFETDDNFYLIALESKSSVFDTSYLNRLHSLTQELRKVEHVKDVVSLSSIQYPIQTPFGIQFLPAVHRNNPDRFEQDKKQIAEDERIIKMLVSEDFSSSIVNLKIEDNVDLVASNKLVQDIESMVARYNFDESHFLGRAKFQKEMIDMATQEIIKSSVFAAILVLIIMIILFRRVVPVMITMFSIALSMSGFMCFMYLSGQHFNAMAGLFPVLMIIVSTSDIIHLLSKYMDELKKGVNKELAIRTTLRDIGLATLLTSITTSIGFATLLFSRLEPIQEFGINAAVGVLIAFVLIFIFCAVILPKYDLTHFERPNKKVSPWNNFIEKWYQQVKKHPRTISIISAVFLILSLYGTSLINTNYTLVSNLPIGKKVTTDYLYFQEEFAGYRPLEVAVTAAPGYQIENYEIMSDLAKLEDHMKSYGVIRNIMSQTMIYKSIGRMLGGNQVAAYTFPKDTATFNQYKELAKFAPSVSSTIFLSKDGTKTRISSRIDDIGAESVQERVDSIDAWIAKNLNTDIASYRMTGTAMLLDKNMVYIRESLLQGLLFAIVIVAFVMVLLFRDLKLIIISIIPNVIPLLFSAAVLGFMGIHLEAGLAVVFAIAFGIAVDDTIHFLSKFKLELKKGKSMEEALHTTTLETGKAIIITTIILFFGFLVMFQSIHPPSRSIGLLIAITLLAAVIADLYIIPILIRTIMKSKK